MEVSDLKDLFFILGVLVSIVFVLGIVMISVIKLHDFIAECIYAKRYEYMIKHRFDDPPLAKCYCIDCKYCYGEPTKTGGNVYCSLWNHTLYEFDYALYSMMLDEYVELLSIRIFREYKTSILKHYIKDKYL